MNCTAAPSLLQSKNHFEILDGLRGIAAVAVVIFHFMEFVRPDYNDNFIAHAYLAVDFFFCLSGFVIAYAYHSKLQNMGVATFLKLRLIRLHPLVVIGSVLGLLTFVFDPFSNLAQTYGWGKTLVMFVASCLLIPFPMVRERYFNFFHLNPPTWSLFWEYVANLAYATVLYKVRTKWLWALTLLAAVGLFFEAHASTFLGVGWGGDNGRAGAARVAFSFLAGMLVYRSGFIIKSRLGFVGVGILLLLAFLMPFSNHYNWIIDPLLVIFYFPFLVALGAGATLAPRFLKICRFPGVISYPLYMVHYPFLWLFLSYMEKEKPAAGLLQMLVPVGVVLLIGFAYVVLHFIDLPLRTYFKTKLKQRI